MDLAEKAADKLWTLFLEIQELRDAQLDDALDQEIDLREFWMYRAPTIIAGTCRIPELPNLPDIITLHFNEHGPIMANLFASYLATC